MIKVGQWLLIPSEWFDYFDETAMPLYVTAQIIKKVRADKPAFTVKMVGDEQPSISVQYYVDKHPHAYEGMEEFYFLNPKVKFLSAEPPTMP